MAAADSTTTRANPHGWRGSGTPKPSRPTARTPIVAMKMTRQADDQLGADHPGRAGGVVASRRRIRPCR